MKDRLAKLIKGYIKKLHVDQRIIKHNTKTGEELPPLTIQTSSGPLKASTIGIYVDNVCVAEIKYRPQQPLSCGARLWVETEEEVRIR